jgi:hypothetical protein
VVHRNGELVRLPELLALQVRLEHLLHSIDEVMRVVGDTNGEETNGEHRLSLAKGDLALVEFRGRPDLAQAGHKTEQGFGRAGDHKALRAIVEADAEAAVLGQVLVRRADVLLKVDQR